MLAMGKINWRRALADLIESSGVATFADGFEGVVLRVPETFADVIAAEFQSRYEECARVKANGTVVMGGRAFRVFAADLMRGGKGYARCFNGAYIARDAHLSRPQIDFAEPGYIERDICYTEYSLARLRECLGV